jgi:hypothetical protein
VQWQLLDGNASVAQTGRRVTSLSREQRDGFEPTLR